ncbi:hypothetical protein [Limosilactobacillus vaginalis]|uniref:hypothetical protein n=1 Tax=Limosilactobacillus vaginalis TaxID=1633 RepID=UPI002889462E|nr:hypothetical protein [Limosilactobacillus vaginalis]
MAAELADDELDVALEPAEALPLVLDDALLLVLDEPLVDPLVLAEELVAEELLVDAELDAEPALD